MTTATPADALGIISVAFNRFKDTVSKEDCDDFNRTQTIDDVVQAAIEIQKILVQRRDNRNLRKRVYPLLLGLDKYARAVQVGPNGTDCLSWIWASQFARPSPVRGLIHSHEQ